MRFKSSFNKLSLSFKILYSHYVSDMPFIDTNSRQIYTAFRLNLTDSLSSYPLLFL